jgi:hypothetical protein
MAYSLIIKVKTLIKQAVSCQLSVISYQLSVINDNLTEWLIINRPELITIA